MRVLVVDDDYVTLEMLRQILTQAGHEVETASNGLEAIRILRQRQCRIVFTDWEMPEMDGPELCRTIRSEAFHGYVYIILLTSKASETFIVDGLRAGADDFMSKPVDKQELYARLRVAERILGLQREVKQLEGLLPICSYCKKIRDEGDHWSQVEDYVSRRTEAQFSHGICPDCYEHHLKPQLESAQMKSVPGT